MLSYINQGFYDTICLFINIYQGKLMDILYLLTKIHRKICFSRQS
jgi:hypothetical protein